MKAISLWQPYASAIDFRLKQFETRHCATNHRGKVAIHAAKRVPLLGEVNNLIKQLSLKEQADICAKMGDRTLKTYPYPLGGIVAIADLTDCLKMVSREYLHLRPDLKNKVVIEDQSNQERAFGNWESGRFAWKLENVRAIKFIPYKGQQGLFNIPDSILERYL